MKMNLNDNISQRLAFGNALADLGSEYRNLVVLDADVGPSSQTKIFKDKFPDRFFQIGIAEQNMAGIAAGLSTMGYIPFISTFAVFMVHRAGDQIRNAIAHPRANVKINGAYAGLPTGRAGATHSAFEDIAIMRSLPNMTIFEPADAREVELCTRYALEIEGPVYLRTVRCDVPVIFPQDHKIIPGKALILTEGHDIAVISTGMMTARALEAEKILRSKGVSVKLVHMPTLKPIDKEAIQEAAETAKTILTIENHSVIGGLGSAVCEVVAETIPCKVYRLGYQDIFLESGDDEELFEAYGLSSHCIVKKVLEILNK
ncbi:MAG TPA: transketolase [Ruminiclostridium sp.]|nr:transketolase [Ruminiclostridium sp.]